MNIRDEINKFANANDKAALHWLFNKYHMASQWCFVASCNMQKYGVYSYQSNRIWTPTKEGRILYANREGK